jgi:hypothetical protein
MKKQWALILLIAILFALSADTGNAQKPSRPTAERGRARAINLASVEQFKEAFQSDAGKIRLVVLISPT